MKIAILRHLFVEGKKKNQMLKCSLPMSIIPRVQKQDSFVLEVMLYFSVLLLSLFIFRSCLL